MKSEYCFCSKMLLSEGKDGAMINIGRAGAISGSDWMEAESYSAKKRKVGKVSG